MFRTVNARMRLELRLEVANGYRSPSQRARVLTETWVGENMYCPACESPRIEKVPEGERVVDFACSGCDEKYQLKGKKGGGFSDRVVDAAYGPMADAVERGRAPSFLFLSYVPDLWRVRDLFLVPGHFSASAIERRRELGPSARRAGWVGCNILLNRLPPEARIYAVSGYEAVPPAEVRERWRRFAFLKRGPPQPRGWTADILACVRELGRDAFTLSDAYAFEGRLARLHPRNRNVRPKIRQQLQVLRDHGIIRFLGRGRYSIMTR